jgi:hypothetical protein
MDTQSLTPLEELATLKAEAVAVARLVELQDALVKELRAQNETQAEEIALLKSHLHPRHLTPEQAADILTT